MIEIKQLTKQFQNETVIDYKDMVFESGKSYMLLGASGCGKSTLLNMIAGVWRRHPVPLPLMAW